MPSKQLIDILDHIRSIHQRLGELYRNLAGDQTDERLAGLIQYLARHEEQFDECLKAYEEDKDHSVLNTWIQFHADENFVLEAQGSGLDANMSVEEIYEHAMGYNQRLITLYRELQSETGVPDVQELFANLVAMEENKSRHYARAIQE